MLFREMPKTKDKLSILGFGCMRLPGGQTGVNEKESIKQIRYAIDRGINYLDTAWSYHNGKSEVILGKALKDGYREKVKIADKLPQWLCRSRDDMEYYLNAQLERLGDKVIDYYLIHALNGASWEAAKTNGVMDFMRNAKAGGKVVHVGFSFHGLRDEFKRIIDEYDWDFCQIQYNYLDTQIQAGLEGLYYAHAKRVGVVVMEPLRGGSLAGKLPNSVEKIYGNAPVKRSHAEWALRWIWNHPGVMTVLSGMNRMDQIDENVKIAETAEPGSLSEEELKIVTHAADAFRGLMKTPCTGCQYCLPCPQNVNIPAAFSFYNNKHLFKQGLMNRGMYLLQLGVVSGGKPALAGQCVACGSCVKRCPQSIDIPAELKNVEKEFEGKWTTKPLTFLVRRMFSQGKRKTPGE